jgi:cytochrome c-type biogenesis protein CcmH
VSPDDPKALFYGAAAAIGRSDFKLARDRFTRLLALNPPQNVRGIIEQQITALDQKLADGGQGAASPAGPAGDATPQPAADTQAVAAARLRITVKLSPKFKISPQDTAPLFVFVRDPRRAGPPLAVKRLDAHFPQTIELSSSDAMIPGHGMTVGQDLEVVARISRGGGPTAQSGDPFGAVAWHATPTGAVTVVIDRQTP